MVDSLHGSLDMSAPIKLNFLLRQRRLLFDVLSSVYQTDVWSVRYARDHNHFTE